MKRIAHFPATNPAIVLVLSASARSAPTPAARAWRGGET
jgi:hypothetical protein